MANEVKNEDRTRNTTVSAESRKRASQSRSITAAARRELPESARFAIAVLAQTQRAARVCAKNITQGRPVPPAAIQAAGAFNAAVGGSL